VGNPKVQPPEALLEKIEEIGDIKRVLSLPYRSLSTIFELYVQSGHLPGGGVQYMAGGGKMLASLVFERREDGTRTVRKYKPGDWELKVDDTASVCRSLWRASRVPEGWPPEKVATYMAREGVDSRIVARTDAAFQEHREELNLLLRQLSEDERGQLAQLFLGELEKEWPVEYLEARLTKKVGGRAVPVVGTAAHESVFQAYVLGYMVGKGWISREELTETCLYLGDELAHVARSAGWVARSRGTGFAYALAPVAAQGAVHATVERMSEGEYEHPST